MRDIQTLCESTKLFWKQTSGKPLSFPPYDETERKHNEAKLQEQLSLMTEDVQEIKALLPAFLDISWMSKQDQQQFETCTQKFIEDAKAFDENLHAEEVFQALRNMWIIWMLEVAFQKPIQYHQAMFGYSMLYPYSDNVLDDTLMDKEEKKAFNHWFMRRLHHHTEAFAHPYANKMHQLVEKIEHQYAPSNYQDVYQSLYLIQEGQQQSLRQQQTIPEKDVLEISIWKGGTSVLADGYLIDGHLSDVQQEFCMLFGFTLQVADDLQDVVEDDQHHHHTLATICNKAEREALLEKLWVFLEKVVFTHIQDEQVCHFIIKNCREMMLLSVLQTATYFPTSFVEEIKAAMPLSYECIKELKNKVLMKIKEKQLERG